MLCAPIAEAAAAAAEAAPVAAAAAAEAAPAPELAAEEADCRRCREAGCTACHFNVAALEAPAPRSNLSPQLPRLRKMDRGTMGVVFDSVGVAFDQRKTGTSAR